MDLVPSPIVVAWKHKLIQTHNLDDDVAKVHVLFFTSYKNSVDFKEGDSFGYKIVSINKSLI